MYPNKFAKKLALDFIIGDDSKIYLIELQHGFGKVGFRTLYKDEWSNYRRISRFWQRQYEPNEIITKRIRKVCRSKALTYKVFQKYQPSTFIVKDWQSQKLKSWLGTVSSPYILAKPTFGSCGEGIHFIEKNKFENKKTDFVLNQSMILQEYIFSKDLFQIDSPEKKYKGCIRHIVFLKYKNTSLDIFHLPAYWRVAPISINEEISRESMTANISRGATAMKADPDDMKKIITAANDITRLLVSHTIENDEVRINTSQMLPVTK